jgi:uncharacterized protein YcfJ
MKRFAPALSLIVLSLAAVTAQAQYRHSGTSGYQSNYDVARVVDSRPIYETVEVDAGREVCRDERVTYRNHGYRERSESGRVLGAIIGGVIGNQFGSGNGRTASTVAGVALGSAIARDAERNNYRGGRYSHGTERVCHYEPSYRTERQLVGYDVTYDYKGQIGHTTTRNAPGRTIRVAVAVTAIEN